MRATAHPCMACLLASIAAFVAPACWARQAAPVQAADRTVESTDAQPAALDGEDAEAARERRSAFGRVMAIMIAALKDGADDPDAVPPPAADPAPQVAERQQPAARASEPMRTIQVGAAFRLDAPTVRDRQTVASEASSPPSAVSD